MIDTRYCSRLGAGAAFCGALLLTLGTSLHPMQAAPWDAAAAFAEYAADHHWLASHLIQLLGVLLGVLALLALTWRLRAGQSGVWALFGAACALASLALAFALQAVDGVALKLMVDQWAQAEEPLRSQLFAATFGVRQIEAGLAALFGLGFAISLLLYAPALWLSRPATWPGARCAAGGWCQSAGRVAAGPRWLLRTGDELEHARLAACPALVLLAGGLALAPAGMKKARSMSGLFVGS